MSDWRERGGGIKKYKSVMKLHAKDEKGVCVEVLPCSADGVCVWSSNQFLNQCVSETLRRQPLEPVDARDALLRSGTVGNAAAQIQPESARHSADPVHRNYSLERSFFFFNFYAAVFFPSKLTTPEKSLGEGLHCAFSGGGIYNINYNTHTPHHHHHLEDC